MATKYFYFEVTVVFYFFKFITQNILKQNYFWESETIKS